MIIYGQYTPNKGGGQTADGYKCGTGVRIGLTSTVQDSPHIINSAQVSKEGNEVSQLRVVGVIKPRRNRNSIIGVENIRCWRIIQNNGIRYGATQLRQILFQKITHRRGGDIEGADLDVITLVIITTFTEQAMGDNLVNIQLVEHRVGILRV